MKRYSKVAVVLVLTMLLMPFCPMSVSAAGASAPAHNCHGEKKAPSGTVMRSCCDDAAVPVPAFQPQAGFSADVLAMTACPAVPAAGQLPAFAQESSPPGTGSRLAQLSLLRI